MHYKIHWLGKLIALHADYQEVSILLNHVSLRAKNQHIELPLENVATDKLRGIIWSRLVLRTKTFTYHIGGLSDTTCSQIIDDIATAQHQIKKQKSRLALDSATERLSLLHRQGLQFLSAVSFIRRETATQYLQQLQPDFDLLEQARKYGVLSPNEHAWHESLSSFTCEGLQYFEKLNQLFTEREISKYQSLFDKIESKPLTYAQRKACVVNEQFNLVLAGAGTGKTSTMIARTAYLIVANLASPSQILMLAYARKAAEEMQERIKHRLPNHPIEVETFHSLGQAIIAHVEGKKPNIHPMALEENIKFQFIDNKINELLKTQEYSEWLINYFFTQHAPYKSQYEFSSLGDYNNYIRENEIITLQGEHVKSYEECEIANFLFRNGIQYEYEPRYKVDTRDQNFRQYHPDFYLPEYQIYVEHFAINSSGNTPSFIDQKTYIDGMEWKRKLHQRHETQLIETYSYLKQQGILTAYLAEELQKSGVIFKPLPPNQLLRKLREKSFVSEFSKFIAQLLSLFKLAGCSSLQINKTEDQAHSSNALQILFEPVFKAYQTELDQTDCIDFDDMILRATRYVEQGKYLSQFKHVLVDEFQDISPSRDKLIRALLSQQNNATLFCVGDDWQSIYRFSGSDNRLTYEFASNFKYAATNILDKTFRFNNKINEVAARFIQQNPSQIKKEIQCHHEAFSEAVSIIKTTDTQQGLWAALHQTKRHTTSQNADVLILSRYKYLRPELKPLQQHFYPLRIQFMTIHESKGKEADFVILLENTQGKSGFPCGKTTHPVLEMLLPRSDSYKHAEERRLFYVALTRAKQHVYLLTHPHRPSDFICELIEHQYPVQLLDVNGTEIDKQAFIANTPCPVCQTGRLIPRDGPYTSFIGCNNYPLCDYSQLACQLCGSETETRNGFLICKKQHCDYKQPLCPRCESGFLKPRKNKNGQVFWGCSNYRKEEEFSCTYTTNTDPATQSPFRSEVPVNAKT